MLALEEEKGIKDIEVLNVLNNVWNYLNTTDGFIPERFPPFGMKST